MRGWAQVEAYYRRLPAAVPIDVREMRVDDLSIDVLGDVAYAFCRFQFEGQTEGRTEQFIDEGRVTFILQRGEDWKVIQYHESAPPDQPGAS